MVEIRTVKYLDDKESLLDLFHASFGRNMLPEIWDWKYIYNPLASKAPDVVVAIEGSKIIGARPFLLIEMWIKGSKIITAHHCNTMVHPDHQNKGIFNEMGKFAVQYLKERNIAFSYGFPGLKSRRGFLSQGYRIIEPVNIRFWPLKARSMIASRFKNKGLGNTLGYIYEKLQTSRNRSNKPSSYQIQISNKYHKKMNQIDSLREKSIIELVRSEVNLRWRFDNHPEHNYKYILAENNQKSCGYAVINVKEQPNGLISGIITDHLVKDSDVSCFQGLMQKALQEFEDSGCDIAFIWTGSRSYYTDNPLNYYGFKSSTGFLYKRLFNDEYLDALLMDHRIAKDINIYDKTNWRITHAYLDTG